MTDFNKVKDYSFEAIKDGDNEAVKHGSVISIIGYVLDESGAMISIALSKIEKPIGKHGAELSLIESLVDDTPFLSKVKETLSSEGFEIDSADIDFLGEMKPSLKDHTVHYIYAANLSGSVVESAKIQLLPLSKVMKLKEATVQAAFMRLFFHLYRTQITDGNSKQKTTKSDGQANGPVKAKE